jgi:peptide/nickel transport system substrate-binding protein
MSSGSRQRRRSLVALPLAIILSLLLLTPLMTTAQDASPASGAGGTLTGGFDVGPGGAPEVFNPLVATAGMTWLELYYSKLLVYDVDFTAIQGELAESWEVADDGLTYTFTLNDGVTWHDGEPFTANDVKFTLDLVMNPEAGSFLAAKLASVESVDVVDDLTFTITLSEPNAALPDALTFIVMLPEHALGEIPPAELLQSAWWSTEPIGTGPFAWGEYVPGEYVELVAYEDYWKGRPQLHRVINRYYKEPGTAVIALRSGEIDFTYVTSDEAFALEGEAGISIIPGPSQVVNYLGFNMQDPRFEDVRVRQAFMYAIDRATIVEQLYAGSAIIANCPYSLPAFVPDDLNTYEPNVETARQLLAEANWEEIKGEPLEILTYYTDQLSADVLVTMQQMLAEAGIEATLRSVDVPTFNQIMSTPEEWIIFYGGGANGPDPDVMATNYISTLTPPDGFNRTYVNIPELDELYLEGRTISDPEERAAVYQEACRVLNEQVPWAYMWVGERYGATTDRVTNFTWTPAPGGGRYDQLAHEWTVADE